MGRYPTRCALLIVLATVAACTFKPQIGMSFDDWNRECRTKTLSGGTLLRQEGDTQVYYCATQENLYAFRDGALAEIKVQPAYSAGAGLKLAH
jgi:hypothetical protein